MGLNVNDILNKIAQLESEIPKGLKRSKWNTWGRKIGDLETQVGEMMRQMKATETSLSPFAADQIAEKLKELKSKVIKQLDIKVKSMDPQSLAKGALSRIDDLKDKVLGNEPPKLNIPNYMQGGLGSRLLQGVLLLAEAGFTSPIQQPTAAAASGSSSKALQAMKVVPLQAPAKPIISAAARMTDVAKQHVNQASAPTVPSPKIVIDPQLVQAQQTAAQLQEQLKGKPALAKLKKDVDSLHRQLVKAASSAPLEQCSKEERSAWKQRVNVDGMCHSLKQLEERITFSMEQARQEIDQPAAGMHQSDAELLRYGNKFKNLIHSARLSQALSIPGVIVPVPRGVTTDQVTAFLRHEAPDIFDKHWKSLGALYAQHRPENGPFLDTPAAAELLKEIHHEIGAAFERAASNRSPHASHLFSEELTTWLEAAKANGDYLMVRSTGAEDTRQLANAGGNVSPKYVLPEKGAFCLAMKEVVTSYFEFTSLQNRINANMNPFTEELHLAVAAQELIGEPIGGASNPHEIPTSLVLFTNEPLFVGNEEFRVMRLSATYGHGEGVVGNLGIATDTALILQSKVNPDKLYVMYDNQHKPERLAPVQTDAGVVLGKIKNPDELASRPAITPEMLGRLFHWGIVGETYFGTGPTDMEIVTKKGKIYPVQARPVNRPDLLPTYLDKRIASKNILQTSLENGNDDKAMETFLLNAYLSMGSCRQEVKSDVLNLLQVLLEKGERFQAVEEIALQCLQSPKDDTRSKGFDLLTILVNTGHSYAAAETALRKVDPYQYLGDSVDKLRAALNAKRVWYQRWFLNTLDYLQRLKGVPG